VVFRRALGREVLWRRGARPRGRDKDDPLLETHLVEKMIEADGVLKILNPIRSHLQRSEYQSIDLVC